MSDSRPPFANRLQFVSEARLQTLAQAAGRQDLQVLWVDLAGCRDKTELLARMADALAFPAHFGHNWDALADCLCDLAWLPQARGTLPQARSTLSQATGTLLLLQNSADLRAGDDAAFITLCEILEQACDFWAAQDMLFAVFCGRAAAV